MRATWQVRLATKIFLQVLAAWLLAGGLAAQAQENLAENPAAGEVREELESGIIANPLQRAKIYLEKKDWPRLYRHAAQWAKGFPGESRAWRYLGLSLDGLQRPTEAADAHLRAWDLSDKKNYRIIDRIGDAYVATGEWDKADKAYRKALAIRPNRATLWVKIGQVAMQRRHPEWRQDAKIILRKILSFGEHINEIARWQHYADFLDETATETKTPLTSDEEWKVHRHVVRLDPKRAASWYRLYDIETMRGNEKTVEKIIQVLQNIDPGNPHSALYYGRRALAKGKEKKAVEFFQQALAHQRVSNPQRSEIFMVFGNLEKRPSQAIGHYRQAITHDPSNRAAWEQAIVMLRDMRQYQAAKKLYTNMEKVLHKIAQGEEVSPEYLQSLQSAQSQIY